MHRFHLCKQLRNRKSAQSTPTITSEVSCRSPQTKLTTTKERRMSPALQRPPVVLINTPEGRLGIEISRTKSTSTKKCGKYYQPCRGPPSSPISFGRISQANLTPTKKRRQISPALKRPSVLAVNAPEGRLGIGRRLPWPLQRRLSAGSSSRNRIIVRDRIGGAARSITPTTPCDQPLHLLPKSQSEPTP